MRTLLCLMLIAVTLNAQELGIKRAGGRTIGGSLGITRPVSGFLLRDDFLVPLAAGSVNGTYATDGKNLRTVTDTENKLSITALGLTFAGGKGTPADGDPGIWYTAIARTTGRMLLAKYYDTTYALHRKIYWGFDLNASGAADGQALIRNYSGAATDLYSTVTATTSPIADAVTSGFYSSATVLRAAGAFHFIKNRTAGTNWILLYPRTLGTSTTLYPAITNNSSDFIFTSLRIPTTLWLPVPLMSSGWDANATVSDGRGHAEGITGGLGSGGGGVSLTGAGWRSVGGKLVDSVSTTLADKFLTCVMSSPDVIADRDSMVVGAGDSCGIVLNLNSTTAPDSFVVAYYSGSNVHLDKVFGGVWTSVINAAATYSAAATLRVIKDGTNYSVYYNNAKIGPTSSITGIRLTGRHGAYATAATSSSTKDCYWDRGSTTGAYNFLSVYLP